MSRYETEDKTRTAAPTKDGLSTLSMRFKKQVTAEPVRVYRRFLPDQAEALAVEEEADTESPLETLRKTLLTSETLEKVKELAENPNVEAGSNISQPDPKNSQSRTEGSDAKVVHTQIDSGQAKSKRGKIEPRQAKATQSRAKKKASSTAEAIILDERHLRTLRKALNSSPSADVFSSHQEDQKSKNRPKASQTDQDKLQSHKELDLTIQPISDLNAIFSALIKQALELGMTEAMEEFVGDDNGVRVFTMCSGTESPVIAMQLMRQALQDMGQSFFNVRHLGSCEIEPFKQAFIERNFHPTKLFRDVTEFTAHKHHPNDPAKRPRTAYGADTEIPQGVHLLIAGSSCVDHSALNNNPNKPHGESAMTLKGVADYASVYRPTVVLLENVANADWGPQKKFWRSRNYHFHAVKVDTKNFYIPQTRERGYSLAIDMERVNEIFNPESEDACEKVCEEISYEWVKYMANFQRRASSPYSAFLFNNDDPRLQQAKAMTLDTKANKQNSNWARCQRRHTKVRAQHQLGTQRPYTNRNLNEKCQLLDSGWQSWALGQPKRELDVLDISTLRYVNSRDIDMRYKSRNIDISQNIDRDIDKRSKGIVGCITPSGSLFETRRGGPIVGLELLALQGMPIDKLDLTKASLKEFQDLAGNAMTTTVIGASILSAIMACFEVAKKHSAPSIFKKYTDQYRGKDIKKIGGLDLQYETLKSFKELTCQQSEFPLQNVDAMRMIDASWSEIIDAANLSQRLCICESLGQHTDRDIKYCRDCFYTCCDGCSRDTHYGYGKQSLRLADMRRSAAKDFVAQLTQYLPPVVKLSGFDKFDWDKVARISSFTKEQLQELRQASEEELRFQGVKYEETWKAFYSSATADLELEFSRLWTEKSSPPSTAAEFFSLRPVWRLFAKPSKTVAAGSKWRTLLRHPIARMFPSSDCFTGSWQFWRGYGPLTKIQVVPKGDLVPSWEAKLGLQGPLYPNLLVSTELEVQVEFLADKGLADLAQQIAGKYTLLETCPAPCGLLYIRQNQFSPDNGRVFFYLNSKPLEDACDDRMEFGSQAPNLMSPADDRTLLMKVQSEYRPTTAAGDQPVPYDLECEPASLWLDAKPLKLERHTLGKSVVVYQQLESTAFTAWKKCEHSSSCMLLLDMGAMANQTRTCPLEKAIKFQLESKPNALKEFAWMLSHAAEVPQLESGWQQMAVAVEDARCFTCAPKAPKFDWHLLERVETRDGKSVTKKKLKLVEDPEKAKIYEQALKHRPKPAFATYHRSDSREYLEVQVNVVALIHRAAADLEAPENDISFDTAWRLCRHPLLAARPKFKSLTLSSNAGLSPIAVVNGRRELWDSQRKTLMWMLEKEGPNSTWREESLTEICVPSLGWRLEAKASRDPKVLGGILADKVGAGKTTTVLELVRQDYHALSAGTSRHFASEEISSHIHTNATLIIVPKNLISQWRKEVDGLFSSKDVRTKNFLLTIQYPKDLEKYSVDRIKAATLIFISLSLFENDEYWKTHRLVTCAPNVPSRADRALHEYLSDSLENLASMMELYNGNAQRENKFWDAWDKARNGVGHYKRFAGVKTRANIKPKKKPTTEETIADGNDDTSMSDVEENEQNEQHNESGEEDGQNEPSELEEPEEARSGDKRPLSPPEDDQEISSKKRKISKNQSAPSDSGNNAAMDADIKELEWKDMNDEFFEKMKGSFDADLDKFRKDREIVPLLHMFRFRRLIVDEFTYAKPTTIAALLKLKATSRWLLSGTPPIHDFDSINTMAKLLGTKLSVTDLNDGVYGFGDGLPSGSSLKSLREEFQTHQNIGSPAHIEYLHDRAQQFSAEFIRQDESSEPKKDKKHHQRIFKPSPSERLAYVDVAQVLETEDCRFNVTTSKDKFATMDKQQKRQALMESHTGPKAALVAAMSDLPALSNDFSPIVEEEERKVLILCTKLLYELQESWYCVLNAPDQSTSFNAFLKNLNHLAALDLDDSMMPLLDRLVCYAKSHPVATRENRFIEPTEFEKWSKKAKNQYERAKDDFDKLPNNVSPFLKMVDIYREKEIDHRTTSIERCIEELVSRFRHLRLVKLFGAITTGDSLEPCSNCLNEAPDKNGISVSGGCGHILKCENCDPERKDELLNLGSCDAEHCSAFIGKVWGADFLIGEDNSADLPDYMEGVLSTRMQTAISIIKDTVPKDELILVFAQFKEMKMQFLDACEKAAIGVSDATSKMGNVGKVDNFKSRKAPKGKAHPDKVLLMQIDSEDAAGWNLQCVNHVIFLAPYVGKSTQEERDTMVQAVGRAHRPGQKKTVHVYHLAAMGTEEVKYLEEIEELKKEA